MASIVKQSDGRRLIQLSPGEHQDRPKIRLGKVTARQAATAKLYVEKLVSAKGCGAGLEPAVLDWLTGLPDGLRLRLEKIELVAPREPAELVPECPTLADWVRGYIEGRGDIKSGTVTNLEQVERDLLNHFGAELRLDEITPGDADEFRRKLGTNGLAEGTIRRRCKRARQFFHAAVRKRILSENPFADMPCGNVANAERRRYVPAEDIEKVLAACPDANWRAIFALARYAGLRTPSETFGLKWGHIDWQAGRFLVHSPKTAKQGKATRTVPLFPRLRGVLMEAFEAAEPGEEHVVTRHRAGSGNLRTQAHRIIRAAGLEPWPKTFQNLRSSLETELVEQFPVQTVTAWLGNTPAIALAHYLTVREEHFIRAAGEPGAEQEAVQNAVQDGAEQGRSGQEPEEPEFAGSSVYGPIQNNTTPCNDKELCSLTPRRLELRLPG